MAYSTRSTGRGDAPPPPWFLTLPRPGARGGGRRRGPSRRRRPRRALVAGAPAADLGQGDGLHRLVGLLRLLLGLGLDAGLLLLRQHVLPDVLDQAVRAPVVARGRPRRRVVEDEVAIDELLPLLHLALEDGAQIVLVADDVGREHEQEVALRLRVLRLLEEEAEHRDVAQDRDLGLAVLDRVADEAADDHRLLIAHDQGGRRGPLVDRDRAERARRRARVGDLLRELEADLIRVVHVRGDVDLGADVLPRGGEAAAEQAEAAQGCRARSPPRSPRRRRATRGRRRRWSGAGCSARSRSRPSCCRSRGCAASRGRVVAVLRERVEHDAERGDREARAEDVLRVGDRRPLEADRKRLEVGRVGGDGGGRVDRGRDVVAAEEDALAGEPKPTGAPPWYETP